MKQNGQTQQKGSLARVKNDICKYLQGELLREMPQSGVVVLAEFSGKNGQIPVRTPTVSVGFSSIASDSATGDGYIGEFGASAMSGRRLQCDVCIQIAVPRKQGGTYAHEIFEVIAQAMLIKQSGLGITQIRCGELDFAREMDCFCLALQARLPLYIYAQSDEGMFTDYEVRRLQK